MSNKNQSLQYSANKTASALISANERNFFGLVIVGDSLNDNTINIYNGSDDTGDTIVPEMVHDVSVSNVFSFFIPIPIRCPDGLYVKVSSSGTFTYKIYYNAEKL